MFIALRYLSDSAPEERHVIEHAKATLRSAGARV
jgi:hypothetical protein